MAAYVRRAASLLNTKPRPPSLSWLCRHVSSSASSTRRTAASSGWVVSTTAILGSLGGLATALYTTSSAQCRSHPSSPTLHLTIYEYPSCPFCGKVRAFLDYHNLDYTAVSVNPFSRKEIEFSESKKLPLVVVDGEKVLHNHLFVW